MAKKQPAAAETAATEPSVTAPVVAETEAVEATPKKKTPWFRFTVMILFGIVYAWDLFEALSNLIGKVDEIAQINQVRELNGFAPNDVPWVPLIANLLLPLAVYGLALWFARRRSVGMLALMLLAGLGVVAAVTLSLIAYVLATS